ncbi:MAG: TolB family protein [Thermoleophilia bacterium]
MPRRLLVMMLILAAFLAVAYYLLSRAGVAPQANGMSYGPSISPDGRFVVFHSDADNLVPGDINGVTDVFLKDTETGAIERVSEDADGVAGNAGSYNASMDAAAGKVVFISDASNLVRDDDNTCEENGRRYNCPDVFLKDMATGEVTRISTDSTGRQANWKSEAAAITASGGQVVFSSYADNLVAEDAGFCGEGQQQSSCSDIFIKDVATGKTELVSAAVDGASGNGDSFGPAVSADGRHVVFHSQATDLVAGDTNGVTDVFAWDMRDGSIVRVSELEGGIGGNSDSYNAAISADGALVVFVSAADNLVSGDANDMEDIFIRDMRTGAIELVSGTAAGIADGNSTRPAISADGSHVGFDTSATTLFDGDAARCGRGAQAASCFDVLLKSLAEGTVALVSADKQGAQGNWNSYAPSLSADGRLVVFRSEASNLVKGRADACTDGTSTWNCSDIFLKDVESGKIQRVSTPAS